MVKIENSREVMNGWMDGLVNGWVGGWMDRLVNGWMDGWISK